MKKSVYFWIPLIICVALIMFGCRKNSKGNASSQTSKVSSTENTFVSDYTEYNYDHSVITVTAPVNTQAASRETGITNAGTKNTTSKTGGSGKVTNAPNTTSSTRSPSTKPVSSQTTIKTTSDSDGWSGGGSKFY